MLTPDELLNRAKKIDDDARERLLTQPDESDPLFIAVMQTMKLESTILSCTAQICFRLDHLADGKANDDSP